jgi:hypothetical protein
MFLCCVFRRVWKKANLTFHIQLPLQVSAQVESWNVTNATNVVSASDVTSLECLVFPLGGASATDVCVHENRQPSP